MKAAQISNISFLCQPLRTIRLSLPLLVCQAFCSGLLGDSSLNPALETSPPQTSEPRSEFLQLFDSLGRFEKSVMTSDSRKMQENLTDFSQRLKSENIHLDFRWRAATAAIRLSYSFGELSVCEQAKQTFTELLPGWDQSPEAREMFFCIALFGKADRQTARALLWKLQEQFAADSSEQKHQLESRAWKRWIYALGCADHDLVRVRNLDLQGNAPRGFFSILN